MIYGIVEAIATGQRYKTHNIRWIKVDVLFFFLLDKLLMATHSVWIWKRPLLQEKMRFMLFLMAIESMLFQKSSVLFYTNEECMKRIPSFIGISRIHSCDMDMNDIMNRFLFTWYTLFLNLSRAIFRSEHSK